MDESVFWDFIAARPGELDVWQRCQGMQKRLKLEGVGFIREFSNELARLLYGLDLKALCDIPIAGTGGKGRQSEDRFLYARCAAVMAGREVYYSILSDRSHFAPYTSDEAAHAEELLEVSQGAYEELTGNSWEHVEPHDYETGSNAEGWMS